ncbi:CLUMA_CG004917, isoform A [Clunio marinus]|uniref:CLUMA_CG004917, isoform A n=1 Tax=Clunio marinus TaxID=568069 RepID=A0A1J1HTB7_9DIPT|nr:CLUMA_CG004917, isoform A [Clunio marinus]
MMDEVNAMNHEKIQNYLKSLSNAGILEADYNGYQPYIKSEKAFSTRSHNNRTIPYNYPQIPIYGPTMGYVTNASNYNHPQSYRSNLYQNHYFIHDEKQSPKEKKSDKNSRKKSVLEDADLSYSGVDRDLADSYLKQIEAVPGWYLAL